MGAKVDQLAFSVKWEVGTRLFHHIINSLNLKRLGCTSRHVGSLKPGVDGGEPMQQLPLKLEVEGLVGWEENVMSLDFCFTSFWKLPFQRVKVAFLRDLDQLIEPRADVVEMHWNSG